MGVVSLVTEQVSPIVGDLKNKYLPFKESEKGPSFYTFKSGRKLQLGICPNSFSQMLNSDIGYGLISNFDSTKSNIYRSKPVDINTIFNQIPSIKIREIQQDSKMQEIASAMKIISQGWELGKDIYQSIIDNTLGATGTALKEAAKKLIDNMISQAAQEKFNLQKESDQTFLLFNGIYGLYYQLIGSTTTNLYELPCDYTQLKNTINASGWEYSDGDGFGFEGMGSSGLLGKAMSFLGSNFSIKLQPRWKATDTTPQTVTISINLFNDTLQHTVSNYIMVNSLMANSMSIQYGLYKHAPAYYDVKISGFTRLFMCKGTINISHHGQTRTPNIDFYKAIEKFFNKNIYSFDSNYMMSNQLIKIPDVYSLELTFESLLPQNFNNYIFQFSKNELSMYDDKNVHQNGYLDNILSDKSENSVVNAFEKALTDVKNTTG